MEAWLPEFCYNPRVDIKIGGITIHYISAINVDQSNAMSAQACINLLLDLNQTKDHRLFYPMCTGSSQNRVYASYHSLIDRDGREYLLVPEDKKAYHAGVSSWKGRPNCNDWQYGTALIGHKTSMFTQAQYMQLAKKSKALMDAYDFGIDMIAGHEEVSPGRKYDPGMHNGNFNKGKLIELIEEL